MRARSHEDADGHWVMWCKGTWLPDVEGKMHIWIDEITYEGLTENYAGEDRPYFTIVLSSRAREEDGAGLLVIKELTIEGEDWGE